MSEFTASPSTSSKTNALEEILVQIRHLPPDSKSFPGMDKLVSLFGTCDFAEMILSMQRTEHPEFAVEFLSKCDRIEGVASSLVSSPQLPEVLKTCVVETINQKLAITVLDLVIGAFSATEEGPVMSEEVAGIVFSAATKAIPSADISLSEHGCKLAEKIILAAPEPSQLLASMVSLAAEKFSGGDKSIFMRFANVWARILAAGDEAFAASERSGAVREIVKLCQNKDDVLVQMVALELLPFFSRTVAGVRYLLSSGMVVWLLQLSGTTEGEGDPFMGAQAIRMLSDIFCHPDMRISGEGAVVSLIASVGRTAAGTLASSSDTLSSSSAAQAGGSREPSTSVPVPVDELWGLQDGSNSEIFKKYLTAILLRIQSHDEADRLAGLGAICNFASSCHIALDLTMAQEELLDSWFSLLNAAKAEVQAAALHAIARVVGSPYNEVEIEEGGSRPSSSSSSSAQDAKKGLMQRVGSKKRTPLVEYLLKSARMPGHELKQAAYAAMVAMCKRPGGWGLLTLLSATGFKEFLEDATTEHFKEGREWKYSLIKAISECDQLGALFSPEVVAAIGKLVAKGPHYSPARMEEPLTIER